MPYIHKIFWSGGLSPDADFVQLLNANSTSWKDEATKTRKKKCTKWLKKVQGRVKVEQPLSPTNNSIFYNFILLNIGAKNHFAQGENGYSWEK